jgi:hypothetical protein
MHAQAIMREGAEGEVRSLRRLIFGLRATLITRKGRLRQEIIYLTGKNRSS